MGSRIRAMLIKKPLLPDFAGRVVFAFAINLASWRPDPKPPLKGGFNGGYTSNSGYTALQGILMVKSGSLTVENLIIR